MHFLSAFAVIVLAMVRRQKYFCISNISSIVSTHFVYFHGGFLAKDCDGDVLVIPGFGQVERQESGAEGHEESRSVAVGAQPAGARAALPGATPGGSS